MPRCEFCERRTKAEKLVEYRGRVVCPRCAQPLRLVEDPMSTKEEQQPITRKPVMSFHIFEVPTSDKAVDHEVEVIFCHAGLDIRYTTSFDRVRRFFAERREKGKAAPSLKAVK